MTRAGTQSYKTTESKYKGGAEEMYVTYDLWQETRGDGRALYPKVKRVYIAGRVKDRHVGTFAKRTGKRVHGVQIEYTQSRTAYARKGYTATRAMWEHFLCDTATPSRTCASYSDACTARRSRENLATTPYTAPASNNFSRLRQSAARKRFWRENETSVIDSIFA